MVNRKELDPTSSHWAPFGVQLRRSREAAGLTQAELAKLVGKDPSYVSYAELASREPPSEDFARRTDEILKTDGVLVLMWLQHKHSALLEGFPEYANHEARAVEIRVFEVGVIPGLLQTPEYATAIAGADVRRGAITTEQAEERVKFLATRQRLLARKDPPFLHAVLDESCLRRAIGGPSVMAAQFEQLEQVADRPNIIIQVAPFSMGERRPFGLPVVILTLPDQRVLGYTESESRGYLERDIGTVRTWQRNYHRLQVGALSDAASLGMIRAAREELT